MPILNFPLRDELAFLYPQWNTNGIAPRDVCVAEHERR